MKQHTLSRTERLKSRKQLDKLFAEGKYFTTPPLRVIHITASGNGDDEALQAGVGVSGKYFRKAVDRNRVKRLLRECWRTEKSSLKLLLQQKGVVMKVFIIYTGRSLPEYAALKACMKEVVERLMKIADKEPGSA